MTISEIAPDGLIVANIGSVSSVQEAGPSVRVRFYFEELGILYGGALDIRDNTRHLC